MPEPKKTKSEQPKAAESLSGVELADAAESFEIKYAAEIRARIEAGLSKAQAVEVQKNQVREDALQAKLTKKA